MDEASEATFSLSARPPVGGVGDVGEAASASIMSLRWVRVSPPGTVRLVEDVELSFESDGELMSVVGDLGSVSLSCETFGDEDDSAGATAVPDADACAVVPPLLMAALGCSLDGRLVCVWPRYVSV